MSKAQEAIELARKNAAETKRIAALVESLKAEKAELLSQVAHMVAIQEATEGELEELKAIISADTTDEENIGKDVGGSMGGITE